MFDSAERALALGLQEDRFVAEYRDRVFRAMASVNRFILHGTPEQFHRASRHLDEALSLGLQLVGADEPAGPAIVEQVRDLVRGAGPH